MTSDESRFMEKIQVRLPELEKDTSAKGRECYEMALAYLKIYEHFKKVMGIADKYGAELNQKSDQLQKSYDEIKRHNVELKDAYADIQEKDEQLRESEEKFVSIFQKTPDPILILNKENRIIEINHGFEEMFGGSNEIYAGIPLVETGILAPGTDIIQTFNDALGEIGIQRKTMKFINHRRVPFVAEVAVSRILIHSEPCLLLQIHNIDEIHRAHDAVTRANRQLSLLSSITRHDITNKLMVILGYINLVEKKFADPALAEYFLPIKSATSAIRSQIEFTKVYQDLGTHEPQWQEPDKHLRHLQIPDTVRVNADVQAIEIYADPMLEKVFFNILDNSIRHGERVTEIRVTSQQSESELAIVVEDNGIGILPEDKENIFQRGFGKNTGLGLFLIREILSITGISIRETGKYEEGARFEILIPAGKWRYQASRNV